MLLACKIDELEERLKNLDSAMRHLIRRHGSPKAFVRSLSPVIKKQREQLTKARYLLQEDHPNFTEERGIKEDEKAGLRNILDSLSIVQRTVELELENVLPYIESWIAQSNDPFVSKYQAKFDEFAKVIIRHAFRRPLPALAKFGHGFLSLPPAQAKAAIITLPYTEIRHPSGWSLAAHEIGHAYYKLNEPRFLDFLAPLMDKEFVSAYGEKRSSDSQDRETVTKWMSEFAADIFALHVMGPAYFEVLSCYLFDKHCERQGREHPPPYSRIIQISNLLKAGIRFRGYDPAYMAKKLEFYGNNGLFVPYSPVVAFTETFAGECCKKINRLMRVDTAIKNWDKIRELSGEPQKMRKCNSVYLLAAALPLADASLRAGIEHDIVDGW